jgi:hypothetical protein
MANVLSDELYQQAVDTLAEHGGNQSAAARALKMDRRAYAHRVDTAIKRGFVSNSPKKTSAVGFDLPDFPEEDIPVERIIALQAERFTKRLKSFAAHTWFPVQMRDDLPVGICWFGDPHLDDNGCNWPELTRHVEACKRTEGLYGANVGDTTNNWAGRLTRLYAEQDTSVSTARRLAAWFMLDSGVVWLVWILGNHDAWGDGSAVLTQMAQRHGTQKLVLHDWEIRFSLAFPNGWTPRVFAAHNFKGSSIWNPMHGPMREGQIGDDADLYICGDKHTAGDYGFENVARGHYQRFVRVRGFKFQDDYARRGGFKEQQEGCSAVTIFDPATRRTSVFMDVEEGAGFLAWKRQRAKQ